MLRTIVKSLLTFIVLFLVIPTPAHAHLIGGNGFTSGAAHPLLGIDHLLAMVAVGVIATQIGGRAMWFVPAAFLSFMIFGGILGINGVALPMVETGIAVSVLLLGGIIAVSKKLPTSLAIACVALFAVFHGHSHGTEMSSIANPAFYTAGFILSTAMLHTFGVLLGYYAKKTSFSLQLLKTSGLAMSLAGLYFFFGL
jgi:urease accessory protein